MSPKYQLKIYPDSVLRQKAYPVLKINGDLHDLIENMAGIMYENEGIGLAAPQAGVLKRIIITDIGEGLQVLINPIILFTDREGWLEEGCLSLPDVRVNIYRKQTILVTGIDATEKLVELEADDLLARVIQHEMDHLNGVLITDYVSRAEEAAQKN